MSKINCDICGTSYPETSDSCPICGCAKDAASNLLGEEFQEENTAVQDSENADSVAAKKKKEIFDYDEVNMQAKAEDEEEDDDSYDEEDEEDDEPRHNTLVVILLTILIVALLAAAGFIFVKYFLPNIRGEETTPTTENVQVVESTAATTEEVIPCEHIIMNNKAMAELNEVGQQFLLNVVVKPENTTEKVIYTSADESIATVSEDGRITAIAEGSTKIFISCGKNSIECPVIVKYVEETTVPVTEEVVEETSEQAPDAQTTAATEEKEVSNVELKLKKNDIRLGVYYQFTLELDCDLKPSQVEWTSEHPHIATVDENGVVTAVKAGTTAVIAKYGDQEVQCMIRCF